jgi:ABC-type tungstate transport system permease subunit/basic membrane lipoprotein Med (substrate-binding protein (PBP1-ABC) superfamily)
MRLKLMSLIVLISMVLAACAAPAAPTAVPAQPTAAPAQPTAVPAQPTAVPAQPTAAPTQPPAVKKVKVGLVSDQGGVNDKSFNQGAWEGVQKAAKEFNWDAQYVESKQPTDYEKNIDQFATENYDVIVTVGFMMGDATALKAKQYPNVKFAIVDNAYFPTKGSAACADTVKDCYADGGLTNVTSLMFQEDEVGFLAGVVAAGVSKTGVICTVSGMEIPPVVRYVTGYQAGAKWFKPDVKALNVYIPSFIDPAKGKENGQAMIGQGCDVIFGVGGNTGNGGLLAAKEKGLMAIGVDVDQYNTYPEVKDALVTSAMKNVDAAVYEYLKAANGGATKPGIVTANIKNGGVGLAPYHDWDSKVPADVKAKVQEAIDGLKSGKVTVTAQAAAPAPTAAPAATAVERGGPKEIILATTTSTRDSGLLDVLLPVFEKASGYTVKMVAVGSGQALQMGQDGNADVLLVHSPAAEKTYMDKGYGKDRLLVMHNDFLIVGPTDDPAKIKGIKSAVEAFKLIAKAEATFVSRGDKSGTNTAELAIWKKAAITPTAESKWYLQTGQGMGDTLNVTNEKGAYTLTDRATYLAKQKSLQLDILVEGDISLLNIYHVITVNYEKYPAVNKDGAKAFADFMVAADTQALIGKFGVDKYGQNLFYPDAGKNEADLGK